MWVAKEKYEIEYVFIFHASTVEERLEEMNKYIEEGYEVVKTHEINCPESNDYSAKLMRLGKKIV